MDQCGEAALRRFWADLVPPFSDPAQLLNISDPDERAVTMLLKTLYVVFKGVLEDRHRLRCAPSTAAASGPVGTVRGATDRHAPDATEGAAAAGGEVTPPCPPTPAGDTDAPLRPTADDEDLCGISLLEGLPQAHVQPPSMVPGSDTIRFPPLLQQGGELQLPPASRTTADAVQTGAEDSASHKCLAGTASAMAESSQQAGGSLGGSVTSMVPPPTSPVAQQGAHEEPNTADERAAAGGVAQPNFKYGDVQEGIQMTEPLPKKCRFVVIGPNDPVPPLRPRSRAAQKSSVATSTSDQAQGTTDVPENRTLPGTGKASPEKTQAPPEKACTAGEPASQTHDGISFLEASPQAQPPMVLAPETAVPSPTKQPSKPPPVPETQPQASSALTRGKTLRPSLQPPSERGAMGGAGAPPEPEILAPETVDVSPVKAVGGKKKRPVPETQAGTAQLGQTEKAKGDHVMGQQPVSRSSGTEISHHAEGTPVQSPQTSPQKSLPQSQAGLAKSPVLSGRSPASRRARRAGRSAAACSAAPPPPLFAEPPQEDQRPTGGGSRDQRLGGTRRVAKYDTIPEEAATVPPERENSPVQELGSPLLLPQRGMSRLPPASKTTADAVQTGARGDSASHKPATATASTMTESSHQAGGSPGGSASRTDPTPTLPITLGEGREEQNPVDKRIAPSGVSRPKFKYGEVQEDIYMTESGPKKRRFIMIGPNDPVPPRSPRPRAAQKTSAAPSTSDQAQGTTDVSENRTLSGTGNASPAKMRTPPKRACTTSTSVPVPRSSRTATSAASPAKTPTKRKQPSIFGPVSPPKQRASSGLGSVCAKAAGEPGPSRSSDLAGSEPSTSRGRTSEAVAEAEGATAAGPENLEESQDCGEETNMESQLFVAVEVEDGRRFDAGPIRKKAERKKLLGWSCDVCRKWYEGRDLTESQRREHMNRCSRHRQRHPPPAATPPGFWDPTDFPATEATQYGTPPGKRTRRQL